MLPSALNKVSSRVGPRPADRVSVADLTTQSVLPGVLQVCVVLSLLVIYFQIYWQYWFVRLMGGELGNTLIPIGVLLGAVLVLLCRRTLTRGALRASSLRGLSMPLWFLLAYLVAGTCSVVINESGFYDIKRYLIYLYSPPAVLAGVLGIYGVGPRASLKRTLHVLLIVAVLFSLYALTVYKFRDGAILDNMYTVDTSVNEMVAESGGAVESGGIRVRRLTIPGLSSTTYAPMVMPLIVLALALASGRRRAERLSYAAIAIFLSACVLMSLSRGALLGLAAGVMFLVWKRILHLKVVLLVALVILAVRPLVAWAFVVRVAAGLAPLVSNDRAWQMAGSLGLGDQFGEDPHIGTVFETLNYIGQHPLLGIGPFNLVTLQSFSLGKEHNNYLSIGASFGLVALSFYVLFLGSLFWKLSRAIRVGGTEDVESRYTGLGLAAGMLSLLVYLNAASSEQHFIWVWLGFVSAWLARTAGDLRDRRTKSWARMAGRSLISQGTHATPETVPAGQWRRPNG